VEYARLAYFVSSLPQLLKPQGLIKCDSSSLTFDRDAHQKKVHQWFLSPTKFSKEIAKEQLKFPDKCLYHLTKSHPTYDCHVKKECALCSANASSSNASSSVGGQLHHLTEDTVEKIVDNEDNDDCVDSINNDTNEADVLYSVHVSNHYLCLVSNSKLPSSPRHPMKFPDYCRQWCF
jgi:hypothetical protein